MLVPPDSKPKHKYLWYNVHFRIQGVVTLILTEPTEVLKFCQQPGLPDKFWTTSCSPRPGLYNNLPYSTVLNNNLAYSISFVQQPALTDQVCTTTCDIRQVLHNILLYQRRSVQYPALSDDSVQQPALPDTFCTRPWPSWQFCTTACPTRTVL